MSEPAGSATEFDQRNFSADLIRRRIEFIPSKGTPEISGPVKPANNSLSDLYLSITLKGEGTRLEKPLKGAETPDGLDDYEQQNEKHTEKGLKDGMLCEICKLPIQTHGIETATTSTSHELSLAHQVCAEHSYPPSHLDRGRQGLKYLSSYGWDPDSRLGLGASGSGIRIPIKAKEKHDTVGLGVKLPEGNQKVEKTIEKLDAKAVRKLEAKNKKHREKLQQKFYGNDDLEKYLGSG